MLTVFTREIADDDEERNPNIIELTGYVCKPTVYRTTPFKREICDVLIAVNRAYNKSDYIPCIAWGRNARLRGVLLWAIKSLCRGVYKAGNTRKTSMAILS